MLLQTYNIIIQVNHIHLAKRAYYQILKNWYGKNRNWPLLDAWKQFEAIDQVCTTQVWWLLIAWRLTR